MKRYGKYGQTEFAPVVGLKWQKFLQEIDLSLRIIAKENKFRN
jgi:hypothetical protein